MSKLFTVNLPDIGEGVVEGEVIEWLKAVGDRATQDEPVVVVMTDKATVELPAPYPGTISKHYFSPGQIAIKGKPLYDITLDEAIEGRNHTNGSAASSDAPRERSASQRPCPAKMQTAVATEQPPSEGILATPATRHLAKQMGIDLALIQGTGPDGRITDEDIRNYGASQQRRSTAEESVPLWSLEGDTPKPVIGIRNLMAKRMALSKRTIPHFTYCEQLDATRLVQLRNNFKDKAALEGIHVTYLPFLIKALSLTLKQYPDANSSYDTEQNVLVLHSQHNIGIAMSTPQGLIVPVLKGVEKMSLVEVIRAFDDLKKRALSNQLKSSEMKEGTFTITNFGVLGGGGGWATPIINPPEVGILGIARIRKQPFVKNSDLVVREALNLSWSFDHRVIDGELAASCSHYFSTLLENPAPLL